MRYFDVFNGDADGICALHQLRLADPLDSTLVTGLKRDIALLGQVPAGDGDVVTVLDISLDRNRAALEKLLARGAVVHYFDHHYAGEIPAHALLLTMIDAAPGSCTSALVDRYLRGRFRAWAVVGAFGDSADATAAALAASPAIDAAKLDGLRSLGISLNYGAYGQTERDVLIAPADMYRVVSHYADPFELIEREPIVAQLAEQRHADLERAFDLAPLRATAACGAWLLPDAPWARRVSGTFANRLAAREPQRAHAVLSPLPGGAYLASVRAPRAAAANAVDFCRRFPTGGGRAEAAGVDRLEGAALQGFLEAFEANWSGISRTAAAERIA